MEAKQADNMQFRKYLREKIDRSNSVVILACPECGKQPKHGDSEYEVGKYFFIECSNYEDLDGHTIRISDSTLEKAAKRWNALFSMRG